MKSLSEFQSSLQQSVSGVTESIKIMEEEMLKTQEKILQEVCSHLFSRMIELTQSVVRDQKSSTVSLRVARGD